MANLRLFNHYILHCLDELRFRRTTVCPLTYVDKYVVRQTQPSYTQVIPFNVWQTWTTVHLPPRIARIVRRFRKLNPEYSHHLYTDLDCNNFIREHYGGSDVEKAYFRINPAYGAARADFWRYCVLYVHGGVYLDIDSTCELPLKKLIRSHDKAVLSHENNKIIDWGPQLELMSLDNFLESPPLDTLTYSDNVLLQWLLIYTPNHPFLESVIENTTRAILDYKESNKENRLSGHVRTIALTGPLRYTDSVWKILNSTTNLANTYRVDGIDFSGKATFQFWGHNDKNKQRAHYSILESSFVIDDNLKIR